MSFFHSEITVVVLHGWSTDTNARQKWEPLQSALQKQRIKLEVLGIPGLSAPLDEVWGLDDYVRWLEQQLSGCSQVILLGHSFGGQVVTRYTAHHADQVSQLILIDAAGIRPRSLKAKLKRAIFRSVAKVGKVFFHTEGLRNLLYKLAREHDYQKASPLLRQTMTRVIAEEVVKDLPRIHCPTLIIWGNADRATPLSHGQLLHQGIAKSHFVVIDGARHSPQFTHVSAVADAITQFLRG